MDESKRAFLQERGWVVIPNVIDPGTCDQIAAKLWSFMASYNRELTLDNPLGW